TSVVACGLIGPVLASGCAAAVPAGRIESSSALLDWFVMMKITGPAPTVAGEIETRLLLMYTVRSIGVAGFGLLANLVPPPQPLAASALTARIAIVVLRILDLALLSELPRQVWAWP